MLTFSLRALASVLAALALAGCGGGDPAAPTSPSNWARLRDFSLSPAVLRSPATATETLNLRLDYFVDFQSNTHLPTFWLYGHLLPKGEVLLSPDSAVNRLVAQSCGQLANGCGDPFTHLCTVTVGWADLSKRRINCGSGDLPLEVPPGAYQFVASTCYIDERGTRVCNSISRDLNLQ